MINRELLISQNPIATFIERAGIRLVGSTPKLRCSTCPLTQHKRGHFCVDIDDDKQIWHCNDCGIGGSVIDWVMHSEGCTVKQAIDKFMPGGGAMALKTRRSESDRSIHQPEEQSEPARIVATYDYIDPAGNLRYQAVRYAPKSFRQRRPDPDAAGKWLWDMTNVERILYHLPEVLRAETVCICEGEKDCDNLNALGYCATTNVAGAKNWIPAYAEQLKGKHVIIFPDDDPDGQLRVKAIIESCRGKALSIKVLKLPTKDISDFIEAQFNPDISKVEIDKLIQLTSHLQPPPPLYSIAEMDRAYHEFVNRLQDNAFRLGKFLPSLDVVKQGLWPGDLVLLLADTGVGKSLVCQCLARCAHPMPTLFFELEISLELLFQRYVQHELGVTDEAVEYEYRNNEHPIDWSQTKGLNHILTCPESGLTVEQIEEYVVQSQLRFGEPAKVAFIDYVGLLGGEGRSRYEQVSKCAESLKVMAKRQKLITFVVAQISRPSDKQESGEIYLHSARDSGALESSSALVIGCWKDKPGKLTFKILKNTRGYSNKQFDADFDGAHMRITEPAIQDQIAI
jgi:5S rRNA maturation endonuclease (ribonuclease M5)